MRFIYLAIFVFSAYFSSAQNTPIVSKVTATWCPNCGDWGWDFMEGMKEEFSTGPVVLLGVHYSGELINPTAEWWSDNLNSSGQPRFFLNNSSISAARTTWSAAIPKTLEDANDFIANASASLSYSSTLLDNGVLTVSANVESIPTTNNNLFISTFIYENNVLNFQSQQGNDALHPNVLRAAMTDDYQGQQITSFGTYDFSTQIDTEWDASELGVITVIWEEIGNNYNILASVAQSNVSLLSSNDEVLDARNFSFRDAGNSLVVTAGDDATYALTLSDMSGKQVAATSFSQEVSLDKTNLVSGMYIVTLRSDKGLLSQQMFVK